MRQIKHMSDFSSDEKRMCRGSQQRNALLVVFCNSGMRLHRVVIDYRKLVRLFNDLVCEFKTFDDVTLREMLVMADVRFSLFSNSAHFVKFTHAGHTLM